MAGFLASIGLQTAPAVKVRLVLEGSGAFCILASL